MLVGRIVLDKLSSYLNKLKGWKEPDYHDKLQYIKRKENGKITNFVCHFLSTSFKVEGVSLSLASKKLSFASISCMSFDVLF